MHRCLAVPVPTVRLRDSLSECYITGRCLPAMTPTVLVMGDEVRTEENFFGWTITINSFDSRGSWELKGPHFRSGVANLPKPELSTDTARSAWCTDCTLEESSDAGPADSTFG